MNYPDRTSWQRPKDVPPGNWQYICDPSIAAGYDESLRDSPLISIDQKVVLESLPERIGTAIDFGCGTGRNLIPLLERGWSAVGVDLSRPMLQEFVRKTDSCSSQRLAVLANLTDLKCLQANLADFGQCLFSTFGMIQYRRNRALFLNEAKRVLKPNATFVVHGHNYWNNFRQPGGYRWAISNLIRAIRKQCELGDRQANYRSVEGLTLRHFTLSGFESELIQAGFQMTRRLGVYENGLIEDPKGWKKTKAIGWILVCQNDSN